MTTLGGGLVAGLLAVQASPAVATSSASSSQALTFVTDGGATVTCTVRNDTTYNTDNANQPFVTTASGESGQSSACFDFVLFDIAISYKDKSGVRRTASFSSFDTGFAKVEGTYSPVTTTVTATYFDCDETQSAACTASARTSPK